MASLPNSHLLLAAVLLGLVANCVAPAPTPRETSSVDPADERVEAPEDGYAPGDLWATWDQFGVVFLTPHALTPGSPSDFVDVTFIGLEDKETFDRRADDFVKNSSHVFTATFRCAPDPVDVVVNSEFGQERALAEAMRFARLLGQLPLAARTLVREIWIHDGDEAAGGGNESIVVHTLYADHNKDFIEKVFLHESAHTSLDFEMGGVVNQKLWEAAVAADGEFISGYARQNPDREDIAESYGAFIIWAINRDQGLFPESAARFEALIPARLQYFDNLGPDFGPLPASCGP